MLLRILLILTTVLVSSAAFADTSAPEHFAPQSPATADQAESASPKSQSPWMLVPTFSSDPKVGTSIGVMAGYLLKLDPESTSSMVAAGATYSNTDSRIGGLMFRSFWDGDSKRFNAIVAAGVVNNDYEDFLGSGLPLSTTDDMKLIYLRYLQEIRPHWFVGGQGVYTNYMIVGDDFRTQEILKLVGLTGFDSGALGLVLTFDDRDNQNAPTQGRHFTINNLAYREAFGGEENFDSVTMAFKHYLPHGKSHVFAYRAQGRFTFDAPASGYSSISLRGYTRGQYLAPHSVSLEAEERWHVKGGLGINLFTGVACLYGDGRGCDDPDNLFPCVGVGAQVTIKPSEQMVMSIDYAHGKEGNSGFYIRFGQAF